MVLAIADVERAIRADRDPMGAVEGRFRGGATIAAKALAAAGDRGENAGLGIEAPDGVVLGIDNKEVAVLVARGAFGAVEGGILGRAAIARVALLPRARDGGDNPLGIDLPDTVALTLDDIDKVFIATNGARTGELGLRGGAAIAAVGALARAGKGLGRAIREAEPIDNAALDIGDIEPAAVGGGGNIVGLLEGEALGELLRLTVRERVG